MTNVQSLPGELLDNITNRCSREDLSSLSKTCTDIRDSVLPRLYRNVLFQYGRGDDLSNLYMFVASILRHPTRASFVRRLHIAGEIYGYPANIEARLGYQDCALAKQILVPQQFVSASAMLQALGSESESSLDAVLALLLILLPHLQAINFTFWFTPHGGAVFKYLPATLVDLLQNHSGTPSPGFLALEEIAYLTHPDVSVKADAFQPFSDVLYLFYMPNITSIQARAVEDTKTFRWPMSPPHRSTITSLSLKNSCMRAESLRKLLHATPNLRKLEYDYQCNFESPLTPVECPVLDCHKLRGVLDEVSASIESLILSVGFFADEDWDHQQNVDYGDVLLWGTSGSLGSMTEFLKLRYLKAPLVMLVGVLPPTTSLLEHQLPEGLREFCCSNELCKCYNFEWEDSDTWRQMLPLIRNRSGSLQKLHLDASSSDISFLWYPRTRAAIEKTCNEAGVAYNVIEYPWPYK